MRTAAQSELSSTFRPWTKLAACSGFSKLFWRKLTMNLRSTRCRYRVVPALCLAVGLAFTLSLNARVLDNFNDNTKTGWSDFSFAPPYGIPQELNGQFRFEIPAAFQMQAKGVFSASTKSTETFLLKEGRTVEFRVDVVQGGAKDSYAVLSWIPVNPQGPSRLQGYSIAKSTTDVLIVKGISKVFRSGRRPHRRAEAGKCHPGFIHDGQERQRDRAQPSAR